MVFEALPIGPQQAYLKTVQQCRRRAKKLASEWNKEADTLIISYYAKGRRLDINEMSSWWLELSGGALLEDTKLLAERMVMFPRLDLANWT